VRSARPRPRGRGALTTHRATDDLSFRHDARWRRVLGAALSLDRRAPRARPRAPRRLRLRHGLPVLRRSGARARPRRARRRRRSALLAVSDLRRQIAAIVERDRARSRSGDTGGHNRNPLNAAVSPSSSAGDPSAARGPSVVAAGAAPTSLGFEVRERRIDVGDLGLEVVGRGAVDPLLVAHLGLRGEPPARWQDILFLDTGTTGLSGGTGTYVFLIGLAHFEDGEVVLRQHLLSDIGAERAFVAVLGTELEPYRACASYNGKSFDLPLLRTRFVMTLRSELTVDESHLDLLHPA